MIPILFSRYGLFLFCLNLVQWNTKKAESLDLLQDMFLLPDPIPTKWVWRHFVWALSHNMEQEKCLKTSVPLWSQCKDLNVLYFPKKTLCFLVMIVCCVWEQKRKPTPHPILYEFTCSFSLDMDTSNFRSYSWLFTKV